MAYFFTLSVKARVLIAVGAVIFLLIAYYGVTFYIKVSISKQLVTEAHAYQLDRRDQTTSTSSVLILGDSTGVGVGADKPEDSVAGLMALKSEPATLENYAVSGAVVADLPSQIRQAKMPEYSFILIQIGANDIVRFHDADKTAKELDVLLATLPKSRRVAVMIAGNVGTATLFPWFMRPYYTARTLEYHAAFSKVVKARGYTYVNLYKQPAEDLFALRPDIYLAKDGFHPSSRGYALWFDDLLNSL